MPLIENSGAKRVDLVDPMSLLKLNPISYKAIDYIENNTWSRGDMEFIFECSHRYGTSERSERVRYILHVKIYGYILHVKIYGFSQWQKS